MAFSRIPIILFEVLLALGLAGAFVFMLSAFAIEGR